MVVEKFNHTVAEKKWHYFWEEKKVLLPRDVSISIGQNSHGACKKLHLR